MRLLRSLGKPGGLPVLLSSLLLSSGQRHFPSTWAPFFFFLQSYGRMVISAASIILVKKKKKKKTDPERKAETRWAWRRGHFWLPVWKIQPKKGLRWERACLGSFKSEALRGRGAGLWAEMNQQIQSHLYHLYYEESSSPALCTILAAQASTLDHTRVHLKAH